MPNDPPRIYWDSCVYISCIENTEGRGKLLREILQSATSGEIVFIASALVIAEVTKFKHPTKDAIAQAEEIRAFFENDYIRVYNADRRTAEEAAEICRNTGLNPPDAIHLATAIRLKCDSFQTYDGEKGGPTKLLAFNGKIGTPSLKIELPAIWKKDEPPTLF